jgi:hypothetical protein
MSTGPITIFDKSMLQGLSLDEAALFGQFYRCNLTPLFFVETLADLEKEVRKGQTAEQVVGTIAAKTANLTLDPSVHHDDLVIADLRGRSIEMNGRVHVSGGRYVRQGDRQGVVFEQSPEMRAFSRWQKRQFVEIEREIARDWREALQQQPLPKLPVDEMFRGRRPKDLAEVKRWGDAIVRRSGGPAFLFSLNALGVPSIHRGPIFERWLAMGAPPISVFAPYAAFVLTVLVYFRLAVSFGFESGERASHGADIAYLFYLPFCMIFTSTDKLHARTVPLFLRADQEFVNGADVKADLRRLDEYFSAQPAEVLERGVMYFEPPYEDDSFLATRLWKQFLPGWKQREGKPGDVRIRPEKEQELVAEFRALTEAPAVPGSELPRDSDDSDFIVIQRMVPVRMGKWRILPPEVEAQENARRTTTVATAVAEPEIPAERPEAEKPGPAQGDSTPV